jgi:hypothetical protein
MIGEVVEAGRVFSSIDCKEFSPSSATGRIATASH